MVSQTAHKPTSIATQTTTLYERLRDDIRTCVLRPGARLGIEGLCAAYGAGAIPLREALNRLVSEGFVTHADQRGFRVAAISADELIDLTRARGWIGDVALRASLRQGDAAWEEGVLLSYHRWERALKARTPQSAELHRLHREFHHALLAACGSSWMLRFWDMAFDLAQRYQFLGADPDGTLRRDPVEEHRALRDAALERDEERALALHAQHLERTRMIALAAGPSLVGGSNNK